MKKPDRGIKSKRILASIFGFIGMAGGAALSTGAVPPQYVPAVAIGTAVASGAASALAGKSKVDDNKKYAAEIAAAVVAAKTAGGESARD